jgi:hypothetical protein
MNPAGYSPRRSFASKPKVLGPFTVSWTEETLENGLYFSSLERKFVSKPTKRPLGSIYPAFLIQKRRDKP